MFNHLHYVPILKFRQGEYLAMGRSSPSIKSWMTPLFELPTEPWDFEKKAASKSLDDHLSQFGKRLKRNWAARCFIDSPYIDNAALVANGHHHLTRVFDLARAEGCLAVPVAGLGRAGAYSKAVAAIAKVDGRGVCLRIASDDFDSALPNKLAHLLTLLGLTPGECDLLIDSGDDILESKAAQATVWRSQISALPHLINWRSLTVAGGSFPATLAPASTYRPHKDVRRNEWVAYKSLVSLKMDRTPTFGDYSAASPRTFEMDPRLMDPNAKVKYALSEDWRVVVGNQIKRNGRGQYQALCALLIASLAKAWPGRAYSFGDEFIEDCAAGKGNGGSSTWPTVTTSHHAAVAVRGIATLFGASPIP